VCSMRFIGWMVARPAYDPRMMGWIQLVVATLDDEGLRCLEEMLLLFVLRQGRVSGDIRLPVAGSIGSGSGRRSRGARQPSTLPPRRVCCRPLASGGFGRVAGCRLSPSRRCRGVICPSLRREEIVVLLARGCGVREIARQLGRAPSTISRELQRNAATRTGRPEYRDSTAQTHADRRARRPKPAKLAVNPRLRAYVQDRLAGAVRRPRRERRGSAGWLAWAASGTAKGPALGEVVEPRADRRSSLC
jgi:hypothetical protein